MGQDFRRGLGTAPHQNQHMEVCPALEPILTEEYDSLQNVPVSNALLPTVRKLSLKFKIGCITLMVDSMNLNQRFDYVGPDRLIFCRACWLMYHSHTHLSVETDVTISLV